MLFAFARRTVWEQQQQFMAFEQDYPDYKPQFVREATPFPGIPPSLYAAFGYTPSDWSLRDDAGTENVGDGAGSIRGYVVTGSGTPPELRQVASTSEDVTGSISSSGDCTFTSASSSNNASSGVSSPVVVAAVPQSGNGAGGLAFATTGFTWPPPVIALRGRSLPETCDIEEDDTAHERRSIV